MSIAEDIINGEICQECQAPLNQTMGFPCSCDSCGGSDSNTNPIETISGKSQCPVCCKAFKKTGIQNHVDMCHPSYSKAVYKAAFSKLNELSKGK